LDVGKNILVWVSIGLLWIRKLAKAMDKELERQSGINWHLFMKIMEIGRKGR